MRCRVLVVLGGLLLMGAAGWGQTTVGQSTRPASAKPTATRPTEAVAADSCATAECHASVKNFPVVHGPVNVNACDSCHKLIDPQQHKYELLRAKGELCTFCHTIETKGAAVVHKAVTDGECLTCHNPHGGQTKRFVRGKSSSEVCVKCHQDPTLDKRNIHGPVAAGACDSCHQAHMSNNPKLLVATGRELCFTCHTEMRTQLTQVKVVHKALEQDCSVCHDAHASNYVMQIKQAPMELCSSCHEKEKTAALTASHKHSVVTQDKACLNCHTPHGGDLASLMRSQPIKVCTSCHAKEIKTPTGTVASVAEVLNPKLVKHGPIRDGSCAGCHEPHGSEQAKLLAKAYPPAFYQAFSLDKYALCFSCHDKQLALTEQTQGLTGFRNGQENLHFVHVNKQDKGRSCRACHATHASGNALHVRDSVPYGKWQMPINFKKSQEGGSCSPGCHKPYSYNRDKPVEYPPTTAPSTAPTTGPILAR